MRSWCPKTRPNIDGDGRGSLGVLISATALLCPSRPRNVLRLRGVVMAPRTKLRAPVNPVTLLGPPDIIILLVFRCRLLLCPPGEAANSIMRVFTVRVTPIVTRLRLLRLIMLIPRLGLIP